MPSDELDGTEAEASVAPRILSVDEILGCGDIEEKVVAVPQWGGAVRIRSFTKAEQHSIRRKATDERGNVDQYRLEELMFVHGVIEPKFEEMQVFNLKKKNSAAIDLVLRELLQLSGMTPESAKSRG